MTTYNGKYFRNLADHYDNFASDAKKFGLPYHVVQQLQMVGVNFRIAAAEIDILKKKVKK